MAFKVQGKEGGAARMKTEKGEEWHEVLKEEEVQGELTLYVHALDGSQGLEFRNHKDCESV